MSRIKNQRVCSFLYGIDLAQGLVPVLAMLTLTACSFSFIDDNGNRIVMGPSLIRTASAGFPDHACNLQHPVEISSLGITVHSGLGASTGSIGLQNFRDAQLSNDCPLPSSSERATDSQTHTRPSDEDQRFVLYASLPGHIREDSGTVTYVETYGLSLISTETETNITIGYGAVGTAAINDDSLIQGNPIADLARSRPVNGE